jgi:hypothetical protein
LPDTQRDLRPLLEAGLADIPAGNAIETASRLRRMAQDPPSFLRGSAAVMAADLRTTCPAGLVVTLCGDAHPDNFAAFAPPDAPRVVDINDFDEAAPGPWHWDLRRLAVGLVVAGGGEASAHAAEAAYRAALAHAAHGAQAAPCTADLPEPPGGAEPLGLPVRRGAGPLPCAGPGRRPGCRRAPDCGRGRCADEIVAFAAAYADMVEADRAALETIVG